MVALLAISCTDDPPSPEPQRLLLVGIDGGDWGVIERLWAEERLPHLRALADAGVSARLATDYGKSPIIWTTMATGVGPELHGIDGFVTADGTPVNSTHRQAPALWNLLADGGVRAAFLGWWATWPAEPESGIIVSDLALETERDTAQPGALSVRLPEISERAMANDLLRLPTEGVGARDRLMVHLAHELSGDPSLQVMAVYIRFLDLESHYSWKYHQPEKFGISAEKAKAHGDPVAEIYEAVDQALGYLLEVTPERSDVIVLSDHGFKAMRNVEARVQLDFTQVLRELGLQSQGEATPGFTIHGSAPSEQLQKLRFVAAPDQETRTALNNRLTEELARFTWSNSAPVFWVRPPKRPEVRDGVDLVVRVQPDDVVPPLLFDGEPSHLEPIVTELSGTHDANTEGIFIASGPNIDPSAELEGISIHDVTSTVLWAFGLPIAEDSVGTARTDLWSPALRRLRPVRTVASHGSRRATSQPAPNSEEDLELLRSLGYIE